jgi:hypothetical protein
MRNVVTAVWIALVASPAVAQWPDDMNRVGVHSERGEESVAHMMKLYAGHDLLHLNQMERIKKGMGM